MKSIPLADYEVQVHYTDRLVGDVPLNFVAPLGWTLVEVVGVKDGLAFITVRPRHREKDNVQDFAKYIRERVSPKTEAPTLTFAAPVN